MTQLSIDDVENRTVVKVAVVFRVIFVGRIVDLLARADAGNRIFEGPSLLRHQAYLGVAADEVAVFFVAFDEVVDGRVRGLRFGWGLLFSGIGHESDHRRKAAVDLAQVTNVAPIDRAFVVARCGQVE